GPGVWVQVRAALRLPTAPGGAGIPDRATTPGRPHQNDYQNNYQNIPTKPEPHVETGTTRPNLNRKQTPISTPTGASRVRPPPRPHRPQIGRASCREGA